MEKEIHIVSFDYPFPADYGGVVDVFSKIKALHGLGIKIHLHCITNRKLKKEDEIHNYIHKLYIYTKKSNSSTFFSLLPVSVSSRFNKELIRNLTKKEIPILFEGLQTTGIINNLNLPKSKLFLRLHNNEKNYYKGISKSENNILKKLIYRLESIKYKRYQKKILPKFQTVFTLSKTEDKEVKSKFGNSIYTSVFHGNNEVKTFSSKGSYCLYHGDLRISDNIQAVLFLISIFKELPNYKLIIASGRGKEFMESKIKHHSNIKFQFINSNEELNQLLEKAHINTLVSFQKSGTKLKLFNALYNSRFCIINNNITDDENLLKLCTVCKTKEEFKENIVKLFQSEYQETGKRIQTLTEFSDEINAKKIVNIIFN